MRTVLERRQPDLQLVADHIHDRHNASALLRTADAFGLTTVNLLYETQEPPELSAGVSGYTNKWLRLRTFNRIESCIESLRDEGLRILATVVDERAQSYLEIDWTQPSALVLGNEKSGCSHKLRELADSWVVVPMQGMAQSLNVSVAAGIMLGEAFRQRLRAGAYKPHWDNERARNYQEWIDRDRAKRLRKSSG
jgi:tRNA (guanosine-2'-O-)-methyltransferase